MAKKKFRGKVRFNKANKHKDPIAKAPVSGWDKSISADIMPSEIRPQRVMARCLKILVASQKDKKDKLKTKLEGQAMT